MREADAPFPVHVKKKLDFIKSDMYRTETNVGKAFSCAEWKPKMI